MKDALSARTGQDRRPAMEITVAYKPFRETAWDPARQYTDRMKGGRCYRDRASGGIFRWFLPYPDDDLTVIYGVYEDGRTWSDRESGCYAGDHMLVYAGIPYEDAEEIGKEEFIGEMKRMLKSGDALIELKEE